MGGRTTPIAYIIEHSKAALRAIIFPIFEYTHLVGCLNPVAVQKSSLLQGGPLPVINWVITPTNGRILMGNRGITTPVSGVVYNPTYNWFFGPRFVLFLEMMFPYPLKPSDVNGKVAIKVIEVDEEDTSGFADEVLPDISGGRTQVDVENRFVFPSIGFHIGNLDVRFRMFFLLRVSHLI